MEQKVLDSSSSVVGNNSRTFQALPPLRADHILMGFPCRFSLVASQIEVRYIFPQCPPLKSLKSRNQIHSNEGPFESTGDVRQVGKTPIVGESHFDRLPLDGDRRTVIRLVSLLTCSARVRSES